jgi:hypothetical protein
VVGDALARGGVRHEDPLRDGLEFVVKVDGILLYRLAVDVDEVLDWRRLLLDLPKFNVVAIVVIPSPAPVIAVVIGIPRLAVLNVGQPRLLSALPERFACEYLWSSM